MTFRDVIAVIVLFAATAAFCGAARAGDFDEYAPAKLVPASEEIITPRETALDLEAESFDSGVPVIADEFVTPYVETYDEAWTYQVLPGSLIYTSYLASGRESRFASVWNYDDTTGDWFWDIALGGRVGILRHGTPGEFRPEGWQLDIEGAAFPRLTLDHNRDLVSADFRFGIPLTFGYGDWQTKFAYYHTSSHLGDEYLERFPTATRINYSRDVLVFGASYYATDALRLYAEAGWAFYTSGGSEPFEAQFGVDYSSPYPTGLRGSPFVAINGRIREEVDWGGNLTFQAGWQWRPTSGSRLLRTGFNYFNGKSDQYQFFTEHEQLFGAAIWYDY